MAGTGLTWVSCPGLIQSCGQYWDVWIGLDLAVGVGQPCLPSRDRRRGASQKQAGLCWTRSLHNALPRLCFRRKPSVHQASPQFRGWDHSYPPCTDGEGSSERLSTLPASHTQRVMDKEHRLFCTGQRLVGEATVSDPQHGVRIWLIRPREWKGRDEGDTFIAGISDGEFDSIHISSSVPKCMAKTRHVSVLLFSIHWGRAVQTRESDCRVP